MNEENKTEYSQNEITGIYVKIPLAEDGVNYIERKDDEIPEDEQKNAEMYVMQKSLIRPNIVKPLFWGMMFFILAVCGMVSLLFLFFRYCFIGISENVLSCVNEHPVIFIVILTVIVLFCGLFVIKDLIAIGLIRVYQKFASEERRRSCLFRPTCSEYAILAIRKYGLYRAIPRILNRFSRCHGKVYRIDYP